MFKSKLTIILSFIIFALSASEDKHKKCEEEKWESFTTFPIQNLAQIAFSSDGKYIALRFGYKIKLWDISQNYHHQRMKVIIDFNDLNDNELDCDPCSMAISQDIKYLAVGYTNNIIKIWNIDQSRNKCIQTFIGHDKAISSLAFFNSGKYLASGSKDKSVKIWDLSLQKEQCVKTLSDYVEEVHLLEYSKDGNQLVTVSDKNIKLWDTGFENFMSNKEMLCQIIPVNDLQKLIAGYLGWKLDKNLNHKDLYPYNNNRVNSIAFSSDDKLLASSSYRKINIWDLKTGDCIKEIGQISDEIQTIAFSHDGNQIAVGFHTGLIQIFNASTGNCIQSIKDSPDDNIISIKYSADGQYLIYVANSEGYRSFNIRVRKRAQ